MRNLYPRLAATNLKKNRQFYAPYLLACTVAVMLFCILVTLTSDPALASLAGGATVQAVLWFGCIVVGFLSVIILFYTNSVLAKHRMREFGLYNILGMEKRHIGRVLAWESVYTALLALALGIFAAGVFSKLLQLLLMRMLGGEISFGLNISLPAIGLTAALFAAAFLLLYLNTLRVIHLSNPAQLLRGSSAGEREPKSNWLFASLGVVCLVCGYVMSVKSRTTYDALTLFFIAVLFVIVGTYLLFTAFSIVFLKALRRNKRYYYKTRHFATVSGMLYRMKRNAAGLASICILSTMVLVTLSTTVSLYLGMGDMLDRRAPTDVEVNCYEVPDAALRAQLAANAADAVAASGRTASDEAEYLSLSFAAQWKDDEILISEDNRPNFADAGATAVWLTDVAGYESMTGQTVALAPGEALCWSDGRAPGETLALLGARYALRPLESFPADSGMLVMGVHTLYLVVDSEQTLHALAQAQQDAYGAHASTMEYAFRFNLDGTDEEKLACFQAVQTAVRGALAGQGKDGADLSCSLQSRQETQRQNASLYGSFLFLGLFLGLIFALATDLIIYYKQVSEGYDDRDRFIIMRKVGMTNGEVKSTIRSQVLLVFFLPLVTAGVHVAFAFPMIRLLLSAFGMANLELFTLCTLGVLAGFAVLYTLVYLLTARAYYRIVSAAE